MRTLRIMMALCLVLALPARAQTVLPDSIVQRYANMPHDSNRIIALNELATTQLKSNPSLSRQIAYYTSEQAPTINFTRGYARALTIIGNSYWYEGVFEFAQNYYLLAARQYRSIADSVGLGQVYNNMGEVNKRLGEYEKALQYLLEAASLKKADVSQAITLYNIGELYIVLNKTEDASRYINQSLALAQSLNDERVIAYDWWSIGRIQAREGKFAEALGNYDRAIALWKKLGETRALIQTLQDLSDVYRSRQDWQKARALLDSADMLSHRIHVPDLRVRTYLGYSRIDSAKGNYIQSLYYLSRHNSLKDSVYNLLKAEQIARIQTIYETEMRERENQQLRADKTLQESQLRSRELLLGAISMGLLIVAVFAWALFRQRGQILQANQKLQEKNEEINTQKEAIETQAAALMKLNEALQDLNKNLEKRIEERSRQLLLQNQKLAEYTFINAHKLRAPVASILGLINLMHQVDPGERDTIMHHLRVCGDQLDNMIREISRNLEGAMIKDKDASEDEK